MLDKNKKYSFKDLKEIFNEARDNIISKQLKDLEDDEKGKNITARTFMILVGQTTLYDLENTLFGKDDD